MEYYGNGGQTETQEHERNNGQQGKDRLSCGDGAAPAKATGTARNNNKHNQHQQSIIYDCFVLSPFVTHNLLVSTHYYN